MLQQNKLPQDSEGFILLENNQEFCALPGNQIQRKGQSEYGEAALKQANFFAYTFMLYYNHLR